MRKWFGRQGTEDSTTNTACPTCNGDESSDGKSDVITDSHHSVINLQGEDLERMTAFTNLGSKLAEDGYLIAEITQ